MHGLPDTAPPPRKRLRTAEHELSPAATADSSLKCVTKANDEVEVITQSQNIVDDVDGHNRPMREGGYDKMEELTIRDGEFYIDDADFVICVDHTLFKVHRYLLSRDSSAFQHMFSVPAPANISSSNVEGCSDEHPVRLYGESAERFRMLLSVIYGMPSQLQIYNTPAADVERLITIVEITNKYHFMSTEAWAVDALYNIIRGLHGPPQAQDGLARCSSALMKRLLEVALLCGHTALLDHVVRQWVDRIVARELRPIHALELADSSGIRQLQGYAYYVQLLKMDDRFEPGMVDDGKQYSRLTTALAVAEPNGDGNSDNVASLVPSTAGTPASLTREQQERLLLGHWSLSCLWARLQSQPPKFHRPEACTNDPHPCLLIWEQVWRDLGKSGATMKYPAWDVLSRLRAMQHNLSVHADIHAHLAHAMSPQCKRNALMTFKTTIKEVEEGLVDHFSRRIHTPEA